MTAITIPTGSGADVTRVPRGLPPGDFTFTLQNAAQNDPRRHEDRLFPFIYIGNGSPGVRALLLSSMFIQYAGTHRQ